MQTTGQTKSQKSSAATRKQAQGLHQRQQCVCVSVCVWGVFSRRGARDEFRVGCGSYARSRRNTFVGLAVLLFGSGGGEGGLAGSRGGRRGGGGR